MHSKITYPSVFVFVSCLSTGVVAAPGDVEASFDSPCAYPAGLATDGDALYVADWRTAKIHRFNGDGDVTKTFDAPTLKPHGLVFASELLFVSDDSTGGIFAFNVETGVVENTFRAPNDRATGLAFANDTLFILAGGKIYRVMPEDGTILGYFDAPTPTSQWLTHDGSYLWVSDRISDELYMVHSERGKVINILPAPGPYPAGIAFQDGRLWNVDFQTRKVYRIKVMEEPMYRLSDRRRARIDYLWSLNNYGPAAVTDLAVNVALPVELPNQTLLSQPTFSTEPVEQVTDQWDQPVARFSFGSVPGGTKVDVSYTVEAEVSAIRYLIMPERVGSLEEIPADIRKAYTADGSRYRLSSPFIQKKVAEIVGDEKNPYWIARRIYDHIIDSLEYQMVGGWDIPEVVLKRGTGSCSEYTYSFIAMCRAAGVPARYQGSVVVRGDDASIDKAFHRWAQIYLPNYGWVPVDANRGDKPTPADQGRGFGGSSNRFLITTQGGGGSEYLAWSYNSFAKYKTTGYAKIEEDNLGFWTPLEPAEGGTSPSVAQTSAECSAPAK